jgi:hypothetical protein
MQQLDYWFDKKPDNFYKFKEPCGHEMYVEGDSWCEELGFSAEEFDQAFSKIGIKHKTKTQFLQAKDKFQGKFYASYTEKTSHLTYYFRNDELVDSILYEILTKPSPKANLTVNRESRFTETEKVGLRTPGKSVSLYRTDTTTDTTSEREARAHKISLDRNKEFESGSNPLTEDSRLTIEREKLILSRGIHKSQVKRVWSEFKDHHIAKGDSMVNWDAALSKWCHLCREYSKWAFEPSDSMNEPEKKPRPDFKGETFTERMLEGMYNKVGENIYHTWIENLTFEYSEECKIDVTASSKFIAERLARDNIDDQILSVADDIGISATEVLFGWRHE